MSKTEYRIHGVSHDEGAVVVRMVVGNRPRLEPIVLSRSQAWALLKGLAAALEVTE